MPYLRKTIILLFILLPLSLFAKEYNHRILEQYVLSSSASEPEGVLIEFKGNVDKWVWVTQRIESYIRQIRNKYPNMEIEIVVHGKGIRNLTQASYDYGDAKKKLKILSDSGIEVSVCGAKSKKMNIPLDGYADFINVAVSAPARIQELKLDGYVHIVAGENEH